MLYSEYRLHENCCKMLLHTSNTDDIISVFCCMLQMLSAIWTKLQTRYILETLCRLDVHVTLIPDMIGIIIVIIKVQ